MESKPFGEGRLKSEEVAGFGWVKGTVHSGINEEAKMWWQCELVKSEGVVLVGDGDVWLKKKCAKIAGTRKI